MDKITASQMIDITRMRSLYAHRQTNPEIETILQVSDNNEKELAEIGQVMIDGDVKEFKKIILEGKIKRISGYPIPETNAVYCLFIPPYYVFTDLKRIYE